MADRVLDCWLASIDEQSLFADVRRFVFELTASGMGPQGFVEFEEYALIQHLEVAGWFDGIAELPAALLIFSKHFTVRRALYCLRSVFWGGGLRVEFDLMRFRVYSQLTNASPCKAVTSGAEEMLASFYGDWGTLKEATNESVTKMMADFWISYDSYTRGGEHLAVLGLDDGASWRDIKLAFRRLAAKHHPDKGGDGQAFAEIKAAYDALAARGRYP